MNSVYLKYSVGAPLSRCIAELTAKRPDDPIEWIARWLYRYMDGEIYFFEKKFMLRSMQKMQLEIRREHETRQSHINRLTREIRAITGEMNKNATAMKKLMNKLIKRKIMEEAAAKAAAKHKEEKKAKRSRVRSTALSSSATSDSEEDEEDEDESSTASDDDLSFISKDGQDAILPGFSIDSPTSSHENGFYGFERQRFSSLKHVEGHPVFRGSHDDDLQSHHSFSDMLYPMSDGIPAVGRRKKYSSSSGHQRVTLQLPKQERLTIQLPEDERLSLQIRQGERGTRKSAGKRQKNLHHQQSKSSTRVSSDYQLQGKVHRDKSAQDQRQSRKQRAYAQEDDREKQTRSRRRDKSEKHQDKQHLEDQQTDQDQDYDRDEDRSRSRRRRRDQDEQDVDQDEKSRSRRRRKDKDEQDVDQDDEKLRSRRRRKDKDDQDVDQDDEKSRSSRRRKDKDDQDVDQDDEKSRSSLRRKDKDEQDVDQDDEKSRSRRRRKDKDEKDHHAEQSSEDHEKSRSSRRRKGQRSKHTIGQGHDDDHEPGKDKRRRRKQNLSTRSAAERSDSGEHSDDEDQVITDSSSLDNLESLPSSQGSQGSVFQEASHSHAHHHTSRRSSVHDAASHPRVTIRVEEHETVTVEEMENSVFLAHHGLVGFTDSHITIEDLRRDPELLKHAKRLKAITGTAHWRIDCNLGLICDHSILGIMQGRPPFVPPETPEWWERQDYIAESHYDHEIYSCHNTDSHEIFNIVRHHISTVDFVRRGSWLLEGSLVGMDENIKKMYRKGSGYDYDGAHSSIKPTKLKHAEKSQMGMHKSHHASLKR